MWKNKLRPDFQALTQAVPLRWAYTNGLAALKKNEISWHNGPSERALPCSSEHHYAFAPGLLYGSSRPLLNPAQVYLEALQSPSSGLSWRSIEMSLQWIMSTMSRPATEPLDQNPLCNQSRKRGMCQCIEIFFVLYKGMQVHKYWILFAFKEIV